MINPDDLLKAATEKKRNGDINGAIDLLRQAYTNISQSDIEYPIDTFLRLPLYLQAAKRSGEAWNVFLQLLDSKYPHAPNDACIIPMGQSKTYDKMRLFLSREDRDNEAVKYSLLSVISWNIGLRRQKRSEEARSLASKSNIRSEVESLIDEGYPDKIKTVTQVVYDAMKSISNIDINQIAYQIDCVMSDKASMKCINCEIDIPFGKIICDNCRNNGSKQNLIYSPTPIKYNSHNAKASSSSGCILIIVIYLIAIISLIILQF
ncbi:MAG: hypothetical protein ACYC27_18160 [Armatimonadota bacterium]